MISPSLQKKQRFLFSLFVLVLLITIFICLGIGSSSLSYNRLLPVFLGDGTFKEEFILFSIRLPRICITILAGMALALSGSILQTITRNDLAEPGIIGINSGAGVAVALFFLFLPIEAGSFIYMLPLAAFIGALVTVLLIYFFSYDRSSGLQPVRLVLVGVGFSFALSGLMIVLISSAGREKVDFIAKWINGNIWGTDWPFVLALLPWVVILIPFTMYKANKLDVLTLSESVAIGVGLRIEKERVILLVASVALAASAVSVTGGISFIGLMAPHIAKTLVGPRSRMFIPLAIVLGGWLLFVADTIGRNIMEPNDLPAGIVSALIGAPYFVYLLLKQKNK